MSIASVFSFKGRDLRIVDHKGGEWFIAKDAADIIEVANVADTVAKTVPPHWKDIAEIYTPGGLQKVLVINESGLYRLIMRSNKPEAIEFQDWIAGEVLPSIRKTGAYVAPHAPSQLVPKQEPALPEIRDALNWIKDQFAGSRPGPVMGIRDLARWAWPLIDERSLKRVHNAVCTGLSQRKRFPEEIAGTKQYGIRTDWDLDIVVSAVFDEVHDVLATKTQPLLNPKPKRRRNRRPPMQNAPPTANR